MSFTKCAMATKQRGRESAFSVRWGLDVERLKGFYLFIKKLLTNTKKYVIIIVPNKKGE